MSNLSNGGYTSKEVLKILKNNRAIDFSYDLMDNRERVLKKVSASGNISFDSTAEIMRTASLEIAEEDLNELAKFYSDMRIRPIFKILAPDRSWLSYPLGIFIITSPKRSVKNNIVSWNVDCYDKSIILKEDKLTDRFYIQAGTNYVSAVKTMLLAAGIDKYIIENSTLITNTDMEFEIGTSRLDVINSLLYAINYNPLHFDYKGFAVSERYIEPIEREADFEYMTDDRSIIFPGTSQLTDYYNVPNVIVRYLDNPDVQPLRSIYTNNNPDSLVSTVRRGRRIVDVEPVDDIADQDTLDSYTKRIAFEKSQAYDSINFDTALMPGHEYRNCLFLRHDELSIQTKYVEYGWSMELSVGGRMNHRLKRVMYI